MRVGFYDQEYNSSLRKRNYSSVSTAAEEGNKDDKKQTDLGMGTMWFRLILFLIHFSLSIVIIALLFSREGEKCSRRNRWFTSNKNIIGYEVYQNKTKGEVIPILTEYESYNNCSMIDPNIGTCYEGAINSIGVRFDNGDFIVGGSVHVLGLMCIFEYFTASFALIYYVACFKTDFMNVSKDTIMDLGFLVSIIWNLVFTVCITARQPVLPQTHLLLAWLGTAFTTFVQWRYISMQKSGDAARKYDFYTRYCEYSLTAPVLFISVLTISTMSGISANILHLTFMGMAACNLLGVVIHAFYEGIDDDNSGQNTSKCLYALLFSWWAWLASWLPYFIIFSGLWNAVNEIPDAGVRNGVFAVIVVLIIFYLSFGLIPSFSIYIPKIMYPGSDFKAYENIMINYVFDSLSLFVKMFSVIIVVSSDFFQPRETCA